MWWGISTGSGCVTTATVAAHQDSAALLRKGDLRFSAGLSVYTGREKGMTALSRYAKRPKRQHPYRFWLLTGDR